MNLLRLQLQGDPPTAPILKIFMAAEPARPCAMQTGLFLPASPDVQKLELTIARLAKLVGDSNIGSPELVDTHRPGEFRMDRFAPSHEEPKALRRKNESHAARTEQSVSATTADMTNPTLGFRMFRPALPANVHVRGNRPKNVLIRGMRGEVIAASGPWRTSGDWWREDTWHQDEWDLEIRFQISASRREKNPALCPQHGLYRFYFDSICQAWFVRGIYD